MAALFAFVSCGDDGLRPPEPPTPPEADQRDAGSELPERDAALGAVMGVVFDASRPLQPAPDAQRDASVEAFDATTDGDVADAVIADAVVADAVVADAVIADAIVTDAEVADAEVDAAQPDADAATTVDARVEPQPDAEVDAQADAAPDAWVDAAPKPRVKACILPLGDSITAADETHLGYRYLLWEALKDVDAEIDFVGSRHGNTDGDPAFPDPSFDEDHEGWPGYHANQVRDLLPSVDGAYVVSHALIHLGTNDVVYHGDSGESTASEIGEIIDLLRAKNPDVAILLAQIIPSTFSGADERVPPFNAALAQLAKDKDSARSPVVLVDQYSGFDPLSDTSEGTHPNARGDQKLSARWFAALAPLLASERPCR